MNLNNTHTQMNLKTGYDFKADMFMYSRVNPGVSVLHCLKQI